MKKSFISILAFIVLCFATFLLFTTSSFSQVVLSEIMFDPSGSEYYDEFIELYNTSSADSIDLTGWQISDGSGTDLIIAHQNGLKLGPEQYGLILDPGYFENSHQYEGLIPHSALILTIDNNTFGSSGLSNSSSEPIILISSNGDTVAEYSYSVDNEPGYSDEKIDLLGGDSQSNWANSKTINGTPGYKNSVQRLAFDIAVDLASRPEIASPGESITLIATIRNIGISPATNIEVSFYHDQNGDAQLSPEEQIRSKIIPDLLNPGDTLQITTPIDSLPSGDHIFYVLAHYTEDQDSTNNRASIEVKVSFPPGLIVINEIMYRPSTAMAEWIELYNPNDRAIDCQSWLFSDANSDKKISLGDSSIVVPAEGYLILAEDNSIFEAFPDISCQVIFPEHGFPALNNSGDAVIIYDPNEKIIDQVNYLSAWGSELGVSLERILWNENSDDPSNWALCNSPVGATPGLKNSVSPKNNDLGLKTTVQKIEQGNVQIAVTVMNRGLNSASQFQCNFYLDQNLDSLGQTTELVHSFNYDGTPFTYRDSVTFNVVLSNLKSGFHQIVAQLIFEDDENLSDNSLIEQITIPFERGDLVINEIMYQPTSGLPEWIELYNPSQDTINLAGWKFCDSNTKQKHTITPGEQWVQPGGYLILSQSEIILQQFPELSPDNIALPVSWPILNNTTDKIVLSDLTGFTIDSMTYFSQWNNRQGVSLERIDAFNPNVDSTNWAPCVDSAGATPGRFNSVSPVDYDLSLLTISYSPLNPLPQDLVTINVTIMNIGRQTVTGFEISCYLDFNHDGLFQADEQIGEAYTSAQIISAGETMTAPISYVTEYSGLYTLSAEVTSPGDLKITNNTAEIIFSVGFEKQSLVINEIMYAPMEDQPEWVELYNPTGKSVDVQGWTFSDSDSSAPSEITDDPFSVGANSFLVLTSDSSLSAYFDLRDSPFISINRWPNLNNDQDDIFIFDANGNIIDEVTYWDKWGGDRGVSLERINPTLSSADSSNWNSCVDVNGATPGRQNSIYVDVLPSSAELDVAPNPFSPDGDGRDDVTVISYQLPFNLSQVHVKIYDIRGRLVRFLANSQPSGVNNTLIWDGRDNDGHVCRMGIYIVYLEAIHYQKGVVKALKKSVVLAKRL